MTDRRRVLEDTGTECPAQKFLVTGGAGFIGSHLVEALLARGDEVVIIDNLSTGALGNLESVELHPRLRFIQGSVLDELTVDEAVHECDVVVHLAAAVGVRLIVDHPLRSFTTNIRGSEIVIEAAHRYRRRILIASTSEIYGKNGSGPMSEESNRILGPTSVARWAYSTAKAVDEILALSFHREQGLAATVVRLFNTVGPRQSAAYGMVVPQLVRQALKGEPVTVFGDGCQTRCFCHVKDVVSGMLGLLARPMAVGGVFNLGSQEEISILELARWIVRVTGSDSPITLVPYDEAYASGFEDICRRIPDITKVNTLTGWRPTLSLDDILAEVIAEAAAERADEGKVQVAVP